jgi:prophage regulatory protein
MHHTGQAMIGLGDVRTATSLSKTTIYRLINEDKFPRPYQLTTRRVAWRVEDIVTWIAGRAQS